MHLSDLGTATAGIWTRRDALAAVPRGTLAALLHDGSWCSPFPHVYADGGIALDPLQWGFAAALASGLPEAVDATGPVTALRAVPCGRTAARVWDLPLIDDADPATGALDRLHHDVSTWHRGRDLRSRPRTGEPVQVLHRHQLGLTAADVARHPGGLWLTDPARTLLDLGRLVSLPAQVCAVDAALHRGLADRPALHALVEAHRGRPGVARLRQALALADAGAESPAETLARLLLTPWLPGLRSQVTVRDGQGRPVARFDLADEELRLAFEADGRRGHAGDAMAAKDRARDARTAALGWVTERATWYELRCQPDRVRRRVLAATRRTAA
ncbi:MAG: hypothetical protein ACXVYC_20610 [Blastococcus sp.]